MGWWWQERAWRPKGGRRVWHRGSESRASGTGNWGASQASRRKQGCHSQGAALKTRWGRVGYPARCAGLRGPVGLENCSHQCLCRWRALVAGCSSDFKMFIWSLCFSDRPPVSPIYVSLSLMRVCLYLSLCPISLCIMVSVYICLLSVSALLYLSPCLAPVTYVALSPSPESLCITVSPRGGL